MNTTIATDDQVRSWLQGEIQYELQNGLDWLEAPLEAAISEIPEIDPGRAELRERCLDELQIASTSAMDSAWTISLESVYHIVHAMGGTLPGERGSRARELQHELCVAIDSLIAARAPWGSEAWRVLMPSGTRILTDQSRYGWLREVIDAWQGGSALTLHSGYPEIIEAETED